MAIELSRYDRYAIGVSVPFLLLAITVVFGIDGFLTVNNAVEILFWVGAICVLVGFCVRSVARNSYTE